jgi:hypothetical protein
MRKLSKIIINVLAASTALSTAAYAAAPTQLSYGIPGGAAASINQVAVGIGVAGCLVKLSADGGKTWAATGVLPQPQTPGAPLKFYCATSAPAVTYSVDGTRLYAVYTYKYVTSNYYGGTDNITGALVSTSIDYGVTWSAPVAAIPDSVIDPDSNDGLELHDLRLAAAPDSPWVYLVATLPSYFGEALMSAASPDQGVSWISHLVDGPSDTVISDKSSLTAGPGGIVLVAYGKKEFNVQKQNPWAYIKVARSGDNGASFTYSDVDQYNPNPGSAVLPPSHPDIRIASLGTAHIVYDRGGRGVFYKYSLPPYTTWNRFPVQINFAPATISSPQVATGACGSVNILHATWLENGTKIGYSHKIANNGSRWSFPLKAATAPVNINYLAGVKGQALVVEGSVANDMTYEGIASSGVNCP